MCEIRHRGCFVNDLPRSVLWWVMLHYTSWYHSDKQAECFLSASLIEAFKLSAVIAEIIFAV